MRDRYRALIEEEKLYSRRGYAALNHRCLQIFDHVGSLKNKRMLEIGGGEGLFFEDPMIF